MQYIFCDILSQKIWQEKFWSISSLDAQFSVQKWLGIHKDFWTKSSIWSKMFQCFSIVHYWCTLKVLHCRYWFYLFYHAKIPPSFRMLRYKHLFFFYVIFKCIPFFKFNMSSQKADMSNSFRIIFIIISMIKVNDVKIYTKNFITRKYDITRIFINIEYIIMCV